MTFYRDHVYPQIVRMLGDPPAVRQIRQRIVRGAEGTVLEIGVGPGANFIHYDPAKVGKIYALEPNRRMVRMAERQGAGRTSTSNSSTFRASDPLGRRGGRYRREHLYALHHSRRGGGAARRRKSLEARGQAHLLRARPFPEPRTRRWQERSEPLTKWLFEGCHVTRNIPAPRAERLPHRTRRDGLSREVPQGLDALLVGAAVPFGSPGPEPPSSRASAVGVYLFVCRVRR